MSLAAPWALLGLLALPLAWWLHRRRHRPRVFDVPSLLFLLDEEAVPPARRQMFDVEMWLALSAILLAVFAAAGPRFLDAPAGRTVRVVVSSGAAATARGYRGRVDGACQAIGNALDDDDEIVLVPEPAGESAPRPSTGDLLAVARAGDAAIRYVIADRPAPTDAPDVRWVSIGDGGAANVGLVAASLGSQDGGARIFVNVQSDGVLDERPRLVLEEGAATQMVDPAERPNGGWVFDTPPVGPEIRLRLVRADGAPWEDDLALDDEVRFERRPLRIAWGHGVPSEHRHAVEGVVEAAMGTGAFGALAVAPGDAPDLFVGLSDEQAGGGTALVLRPLEGDVGGRRAGRGSDVIAGDPAVLDLTGAGVDLWYAPDADVPPSGARTLLGRDAGGRTWPVVARRGRTLFFLPDPLAGAPSPAESALWPLFVDNVLQEAAGGSANASWGYRIVGLLDASTSRPGRTVTAPDVEGLGAVPADRVAVWSSLRPAIVALAVVACLFLWAWPRIRRARRRSRQGK